MANRLRQCMDRYLALMLLGGAVALVGVGMTTYTLAVTPEAGVNIGGGFVVVAGVVLLALGGALRGE